MLSRKGGKLGLGGGETCCVYSKDVSYGGTSYDFEMIGSGGNEEGQIGVMARLVARTEGYLYLTCRVKNGRSLHRYDMLMHANDGSKAGMSSQSREDLRC